MDSFEWNKIAAAVLVGVLLFMGVTLLSDSFFPEKEFKVAGAGDEMSETRDAAPAEEEPAISVLALLPTANLSAGERSFRKCQACHTINEGGDHRVGPNLYGVLGAAVAAKAGYSYSSALSGHGGTWTYEDLDAFLSGPSNAVPGTKMSFAGLKDAEERANVIAYIREQSANPLPLPEPVAVEEEQAIEEGGGK